MTRDKELEALRKQLAVSKKKASIVRKRLNIESEKSKIKKELFMLKNPTVSRIGRGFKVLGKKAGKGIKRQAELIRERQIQQAKKIKKGRKRTSSGFEGNFDPLNLDF